MSAPMSPFSMGDIDRDRPIVFEVSWEVANKGRYLVSFLSFFISPRLSLYFPPSFFASLTLSVTLSLLLFLSQRTCNIHWRNLGWFCTSVGGIYTVIRSKAPSSVAMIGDNNYFCVGIYNGEQARTEVEVCDPPNRQMTECMVNSHFLSNSFSPPGHSLSPLFLKVSACGFGNADFRWFDALDCTYLFSGYV